MLEGMIPPVDSNLCKVSKLAADLSPEDNGALQDALADIGWTTSALGVELRRRGFNVGDTMLRRHRIKVCTCAR
jgi:hypothetical protein